MKNEIEDIDINLLPQDDLMKEKKKKVNGNAKGKNYERNLANRLSELLGDLVRRTPSSGALMGGINWIKNQGINEAANETLVGDLIVPSYFGFVCELKNYADVPKISHILETRDLHLDKWLVQASGDGAKVNKSWLLLFRVTQTRKSYVCLFYKDLLEYITHRNMTLPESYTIYKREYIILDQDIFFDVYLKELKKVEDRFYKVK